jgi:hypothetical protein
MNRPAAESQSSASYFIGLHVYEIARLDVTRVAGRSLHIPSAMTCELPLRRQQPSTWLTQAGDFNHLTISEAAASVVGEIRIVCQPLLQENSGQKKSREVR